VSNVPFNIKAIRWINTGPTYPYSAWKIVTPQPPAPTPPPKKKRKIWINNPNSPTLFPPNRQCRSPVYWVLQSLFFPLLSHIFPYDPVRNPAKQNTNTTKRDQNLKLMIASPLFAKFNFFYFTLCEYLKLNLKFTTAWLCNFFFKLHKFPLFPASMWLQKLILLPLTLHCAFCSLFQ